MRALHARLPKNFVLEERLEAYSSVIEPHPEALRGMWASACAPITAQGHTPYSEVRVDLGCGKGSFTAAQAKANPDVLFVAIDTEPICISYAAKTIYEAGIPNAIVVPGTGMKIDEYFSPEEVSVIYLNFPAPFPRIRQAKLRLTDAERLMQYRNVLAKEGVVRLKTDSQPLYDFSLEQVEVAGYNFIWQTRDAQADFPNDVPSEYEQKLGAQGAKVHAYLIAPGPVPADFTPTKPVSLVDYLPEDLESLTYVPHGMESTVRNLANRARRLRKKAQ